MGRNQIYCCICGAPMLDTSQRDDESDKWLTEAVLLTTGHDKGKGFELDAYWPQPPGGAFAFDLGPNPPEDSQRRILQLEAQCDDNNRFLIFESGKTVEAFSVETDLSSPAITAGGHLYLAVHSHCNQVAKRFIESRIKTQDTFEMHPEDQIASVKQLWEVLYRRMPGSLPLTSEYILPEPYDYFGGKQCRNVYWERADNEEEGEMLEEDPLEISHLTESILQNLQPEPSERPKEKLAEAKSGVQHASQATETAHSQYWWFEAFRSKKLFPWLWDLDNEVVSKKHQDGNWDWELMACKLSDVKIHEPSDSTLSLPLGLRNRRRIWRVLEEARLNDVASRAKAPRP